MIIWLNKNWFFGWLYNSKPNNVVDDNEIIFFLYKITLPGLGGAQYLPSRNVVIYALLFWKYWCKNLKVQNPIFSFKRPKNFKDLIRNSARKWHEAFKLRGRSGGVTPENFENKISSYGLKVITRTCTNILMVFLGPCAHVQSFKGL